MSAVAELAAEVAMAEQIGHNGPPEPTPFDAVKANMDDYLLEARNWADGVEVETQEQADTISRLMEDLRLAAAAADAARISEKTPLDEQIEEIQGRYNPYLAPLKNKTPGKIPLAIEALKAALAPFLKRLAAEQAAEAERKRQAAEEAARVAAAAIAEAQTSSSLAVREQAEELVKDASRAVTVANQAEKAKAHAKGGARAVGLRTYYSPVLVDGSAALKHYMVRQPDELRAFLLQLATTDVAGGIRSIPGFEIVEEQRVA